MWTQEVSPSTGDLARIASRIPSMGGRGVGRTLQRAARSAPPQTAIVEVGCWLGSGTAQLALGLRERDRIGEVALHCFDRWRARSQEAEKAAAAGLQLSVGEDLLPRVKHVLDRFGIPVWFHQGDLLHAEWDGGPISVYVDDAAKSPELFYRMLCTFGPSWIPGETMLILMDFHRWKTTESDRDQCQMHFVNANRECFEPVAPNDDTGPTTSAVFRYTRPIASLHGGRLRDRWNLWLQLVQGGGIWPMLKAGRLRDLWHFFRLQSHPLRYRAAADGQVSAINSQG